MSTKAIGSNAGGTELQKNYLAKVAILGTAADVFQIHWFDLADGEPDSSSSDPYQHMGLYHAIDGLGPDGAMVKPTSWAYATTSRHLDGVTYDDAATNALGVASPVRAWMSRESDGRRTIAAWARSSSADDAATGSLSIPTTVLETAPRR